MKPLLLLILLTSCHPRAEKPFIVIEKYQSKDNPIASYWYQDNSGKQHHFEEDRNKYNVGDTLK